MQTRYTLDEANEALRLVRVIALELADRRAELLPLRVAAERAADRADYARDARLRELEEASERCRSELEQLGLTILREEPLTLHFPGASRVEGGDDPQQPVVFCWQEGEDAVGFGHADGEEEHPRRPLRVGRTS
ncbi:MAG: DUF2203 family protein [Planctomycetota bacterium]